MSLPIGIQIYFGPALANLYDVGYLTTDIHQLITFSELLLADERRDIKTWFGKKARPFNRYAGVLDRYRQKSEIKEARNGSLELYIKAASTLVPIIVPLAAIYVKRALGKSQVIFEITANDAQINQVLDSYEKGTFGDGAEALNLLFAALKQMGYSVTINSKDAFLIHDVLVRYSQRMVRTIQKR